MKTFKPNKPKSHPATSKAAYDAWSVLYTEAVKREEEAKQQEMIALVEDWQDYG